WKWAIYFGVGFLLAFAASAEYSAAIPAILIGICVLIRGTSPKLGSGSWAWLKARRHILAIWAGAIIPSAATAAYHSYAFGGPFDIPYRHMVVESSAAGISVGWGGLTTPSLDELGRSFFSPSLGLFFFSPFLLLFIVGAVYAYKG